MNFLIRCVFRKQILIKKIFNQVFNQNLYIKERIIKTRKNFLILEFSEMNFPSIIIENI